MVRLTEAWRKEEGGGAGFQFHYGAINRGVKTPIKKANADFNSTMVRLTG